MSKTFRPLNIRVAYPTTSVPNYQSTLCKIPEENRASMFFCYRVVHNALLLVFARDILNELINTTATPDWLAFCTRVTVNVFTKAVSALYVQQFSPKYLEELRQQVGFGWTLSLFPAVNWFTLCRVSCIHQLHDYKMTIIYKYMTRWLHVSADNGPHQRGD
jgi:hypothetical protein